MSRRLASLLLLGAFFTTVLLGACAQKKFLAVDNLPPETRLFVQGSLDTVNHVVQIYWFGSDPDGDVAGFEVRFINPALPADTAWVFTNRTDSLFTAFTPAGYGAPRFEVRALDNTGTRDPSPAVADFQFSNQPPTVIAGIWLPFFTPGQYLLSTVILVLGGILGISAMVPLRRLLIVRSADELPYPEGKACAEVLRATMTETRGGSWIVYELAIGMAVKLVIGGACLLPPDLQAQLPVLPNAELALEVAPALIAVGYILGYRQSAIMVSGSLISWLVLIPLIALVGDNLTAPLFPEASKTIRELSASAICAAPRTSSTRSPGSAPPL